jgi:hypothetical protein
MPFEIRFITSLLGVHVYIAASEQGVKDETPQICAELTQMGTKRSILKGLAWRTRVTEVPGFSLGEP